MREDYQPALAFAILTGCRRAEIVGLTWARVDFFNRCFTVTGKGDKIRTIPMSSAVHELLWSLKDHHPEAVFTYRAVRARKPTQCGGARVRGQRYPITIEGFKTAWRRGPKASGVADFRFHDTRHTAASRLVRARGNLKLAQKMLGHSDLATTTKYAHVTDDDLREAMEAASTAPTKTSTQTPPNPRRRIPKH
ncbi:site-specific integrase [Aurantimonas sp. VKM B-3413]|nr:site-specific integrase [Aurantimonas sp. VKM B-3413]